MKLSHSVCPAVPLAVPLSHSENRVGHRVGQARSPYMTVYIDLLSHSHPYLRFQPSRARTHALSGRARARLHATPYAIQSGTSGTASRLAPSLTAESAVPLCPETPFEWDTEWDTGVGQCM